MRENDLDDFVHINLVFVTQLRQAFIVLSVLKQCFDVQVVLDQVRDDGFHVPFDAVAVPLDQLDETLHSGEKCVSLVATFELGSVVIDERCNGLRRELY